MAKTRHRNVRVYQTLRSAHLERAQLQRPASILYVRRNYDFDESLAEGLDLIRAGALRAALILLRSKISVCEINEPLMRHELVRTALGLSAVKLSARFRGTRARVVCYAIENLNPYQRGADIGLETARSAGTPNASWSVKLLKARLRLRLDGSLSRWVARRVDRIAFGTPGAEDLYRSALGEELASAVSIMIPALPAPCDCPPADKEPQTALFLGALAPRKGFDRLIQAWPAAHAEVPAARLAIIGTGTLVAEALEFAGRHDEVRLAIDPPRSEVHGALRRASVVILLPQRGPNWREQVGLPLVEGLAHGCRVLTTDETGLASWLSAHGHRIIRTDAALPTIENAIADELVGERGAASILADLPPIDGRMAADAWLFDSFTAGAVRAVGHGSAVIVPPHNDRSMFE